MANLETLEKCFEVAQDTKQKYIGLLVQIEGFKEPQLIINQSEDFYSGLICYKKLYDEDLNLGSLNKVKIISHAFGSNIDIINDYLRNNKLSKT